MSKLLLKLLDLKYLGVFVILELHLNFMYLSKLYATTINTYLLFLGINLLYYGLPKQYILYEKCTPILHY